MMPKKVLYIDLKESLKIKPKKNMLNWSFPWQRNINQIQLLKNYNDI